MIAESRRDRWTIAVLCLITFSLCCWYTLPSPYFLDSYGYVVWIEEWRRGGELPSSYRYANTLLYYWPVALFGEYGLKIVGVAVTTALTATYYAMIRRDFSPTTALGATLLFLSAPPTVITATHLKEDLTSLLFFSISVLLLRPRAGLARVAAAGVAYGLSLLFKEVLLGALPFILAYLHMRVENIRSFPEAFDARKLLSGAPRVVVFLLASATAVLAVSPTRIGDFAMMAGSPYMGQFLGLFSAHQSVGLRFWDEALLYLHPWYLLPVAFFATTLGRRPPEQALYLPIAIVLLSFLANVSVVRMRHYVPVLFFLAPVIAGGTRAGFDLIHELLAARGWRPARASAATVAICAAVAVAQIQYVRPTIDYRQRYAPSRRFFAPLASALPRDALLLGMDNCTIARHESGLPCESRPPDLSAEAARRYADTVAAAIANRPVYLLPDVFDYDARREVRRAFESTFATRPVYQAWWEPYHPMTYGVSIDDFIAGRLERNPACTAARHETQPLRVSDDLTLDQITIQLDCPTGSPRTVVTAYDGHLTFLSRRTVSIVELREAR